MCKETEIKISANVKHLPVSYTYALIVPKDIPRHGLQKPMQFKQGMPFFIAGKQEPVKIIELIINGSNCERVL